MVSETRFSVPRVSSGENDRIQPGKKVKDSAWVAAIVSAAPSRPAAFSAAPAHLVQVAHQARRPLAQVLAGGVQHHPLRRAHDQRRPDPGLQRPDAAAEGRLGDVPRLRRPGEVPVLRQREEVLEPVQLHG